MFSVVIPLYDKGALIKRSIDSVLSQTFQEFEIVVVDDGSKDDSADFVKAYSDDRVKYYYKANGGVSSARNYGIEKSTKDWIVFLDADDELLQNALETLRRMIQQNRDTRFVVGKNVWVKSGQSRESCFAQIKNENATIVSTCNPHFHLWMQKFYSAPRNTAIHRSLLLSSKGFDERMSFYEDFEFVLRLLENQNIVYTSEPVAIYYQEETGLSGSSHPIEKEMAYYIPEQVATASFWHKALLYENIEMEILWWQQHGNEVHVKFYQDMQKKYFSGVFSVLHWLRQKMIRRGII